MERPACGWQETEELLTAHLPMFCEGQGGTREKVCKSCWPGLGRAAGRQKADCL